MAKYHISPNTGKVGLCRAKIKCRFGGESGKENHFTDKSLAEKRAEELFASDNNLTGVRRARPSAFDKNKENILKGLKESGLVSSRKKLPEVSNEKEMIEKWFGGNVERYNIVKRISDPESSLKANTKKAVGKIAANSEARFVTDVDFNPKTLEGSGSQTDFIEDFDLDSINLKDLGSGKLKAF